MSGKMRRNAVVLTLAVLVCAAAVLNWKFTEEQPGKDPHPVEETGTKILGEAALVSGSETTAKETAEKEGKKDEGKREGKEEGSDYFASARLTRQQARDNAISMLEEAASQESADQSVLNEASQGIQVLAGYTAKEAQIENLVTAKGYQECVAFMGAESVSVVVSTENGELSAGDVAKITDIARNETGYPAGKIKIMAAN